MCSLHNFRPRNVHSEVSVMKQSCLVAMTRLALISGSKISLKAYTKRVREGKRDATFSVIYFRDSKCVCSRADDELALYEVRQDQVYIRMD